MAYASAWNRCEPERLKTMVIVVISADIQPGARERVLQLGALDFIRKPIDREKLLGEMLTALLACSRGRDGVAVISYR